MIQDVIYYWRGLYNQGYDGPRPHDFLIERPAYIFVYDDYYDTEENKIPLIEVLNRSPAAKDSVLFFTAQTNPQLDFPNYRSHSLIHTTLTANLTCGFDIRKGKYETNHQKQLLKKSQPFNFIVNKSRLHRVILLLLLQHFDLKTDSYSFTWPNNNFDHDAVQRLVQSSTLQNKNHINWSTLNLANKKHITDQDQYCGNFLIERPSGLKSICAEYLDQIYKDSFVSLIQEPNFESLASQYTEKTFLSVLNQNLMIWPGGYQQASEFESLGFDIFRDIVDHSYEKHADPLKRIFYALQNNLHLLRDSSISSEFYKKNHVRFIRNIERLQDLESLKKNMFNEYKRHIHNPLHQEIQLRLADAVAVQMQWKSYRHVREFHKTGYQVTPIHRLLDP